MNVSVFGGIHIRYEWLASSPGNVWLIVTIAGSYESVSVMVVQESADSKYTRFSTSVPVDE